MARLLVGVRDPLDLAKPAPDRHPLLLDAYVRVELEGTTLRDVIRIPRSALRNGNQVWVMTGDGSLAIRDVTIAWSGPGHVDISAGLDNGERVVTSGLAAPVPGMALRTAAEPAPSQPGRKG